MEAILIILLLNQLTLLSLKSVKYVPVEPSDFSFIWNWIRLLTVGFVMLQTLNYESIFRCRGLVIKFLITSKWSERLIYEATHSFYESQLVRCIYHWLYFVYLLGCGRATYLFVNLYAFSSLLRMRPLFTYRFVCPFLLGCGCALYLFVELYAFFLQTCFIAACALSLAITLCPLTHMLTDRYKLTETRPHIIISDI